MQRIRIYRNPGCPKCARYAAVHRFFDWLGRVDVSTAVPKTGALRMGEVVLEKLNSGAILRGAAAFAEICRQIPVYAPFRALLRLRAFRAYVDRDMSGCGGGVSPEDPPHAPT